MPSNYTSATAQQVINGMSAQAGISPALVQVWLQKENGCCNNPFGANSWPDDAGQWHNRAYPTLAAGIAANAQLLNTGSSYANVRANRGRSTMAQAYALAASPWGPTGAYFASFPSLGLPIVKGHPPADWSSERAPAGAGPTGTPMPSPTPSPTPSPSAPPASSTPTGNDLSRILNKPTSAVLTADDVNKVADYFANSPGQNPVSGLALRGAVHGALDQYVGHTIGSVPANVVGAFLGAVATIPDVPATTANAAADAAISAALGAVVPLIVGAGVVLVVVMLAAGGARDVVG